MASTDTKSIREALMQPPPSPHRTRARPRVIALLLAGLLCLAAGACGGGHSHKSTTSNSVPAPSRLTPEPGGVLARPNIVFVLTDDLSMDLLRFMPHVQEMQRHGLTFNDYFVSDSLCCPSRSSIFTGNFPHDTGVFGNGGPAGGYHVFYRRGEERRTFAIALQRAGYRTALMGKYLNGYGELPGEHQDGGAARVPLTYFPPGWNEWDVVGWGYPEFNYRINENGALRAYGTQPSDYLTDVLARKGVAFINDTARAGRPFFLEIATFAPHTPYVPAPRNANDFPGLQAPRPPNFDVRPTHAPLWLATHRRLSSRQIAQINIAFRRRAQAVEAVDALIAQIEAALRENGVARNTYIVFSSDNGLHTGEYRLMPGKLTAFDTDIHVPLIVTGPHVPTGRSTDRVAENIDLAKTFAAIGGTHLYSDGHNLLALLHGKTMRNWRNAALIEHRSGLLTTLDPDFQQTPSGNPTTYEAIRTRRFLYVEYADGEREYYDLRVDPFELHNIARALPLPRRVLLHDELIAMEHCHNGRACWAAMHVRSGA